MSIGTFASRFTPCMYGRYLKSSRLKQQQRVAKLLARSSPPTFLDSDALFDALQGRSYPKAAAYGYDDFSGFCRASERLVRLGTLLPELKNPCRILEVSCGDGLTGYLLAEAGHDVRFSDIEDWRFKKARSLPFDQADICTGHSGELGQFDVVIAYNATEHWKDPSLALRHLLKFCRPDGLIVLDFGPLFNSPWGLHAWCFNFPYPQFLFSNSFIEEKVPISGVTDLARNLEKIQETNGWSVRQFRNLWHSLDCRVVHLFEDRDMRYLNMIEEFPDVFCSLDLTLDELTVNSIEIVLRRSGS